ncbi:MAG: hypothetical protein IPN17_21055 [Deltaproteobacteria bacterium]|nr:hypothetical protein [Deltaproteobacteria bacterium]
MSAVAHRWFPAFVAFGLLAGCGRSRAPAPARPSDRRVVDAGRDSFIRHARRPLGGCPGASSTSTEEGSLHGDTVAGVERWLASESPHRLPYGLHVHPGAELAIEPCALLLVGAGMEVVVHGGATLHASTVAERPIRFARLDPAHPWQALELRADVRAGAAMDGVILEGGGAAPSERGVTAATLRLAMRAGLRAAGLTIVGGEAWGVALVGDGRFADRDATIELRGLRGEGAVTVEDVNRVGDLPRLLLRDNASNDVRVEARVRTLSADARWRSLGEAARYRVRPAMHLVVEGERSPTLTLEAGARISFGADAELDVGFGAPGALVAEGNALLPVVFDGAEEERWVGVQMGPRLDVARSRLAFVRIEHAGAPSGVVLPTCGCPGAHPDEAMLTLQGVDAPELLRSASFVDGPPAGFAVVLAGDFPDFSMDPVGARAASDFTRSGVRCRASSPMRRGRCAPGSS